MERPDPANFQVFGRLLTRQFPESARWGGLENRERVRKGLRAGRSNVNPPNPAAQRLTRRPGSESFRAFVVSTCGQRLSASVAFGAAFSVCGRFGRSRVGGGRRGAQPVETSLTLAPKAASG